MEQHSLLGRTEDEILWYQRRSFLTAAAAWTSLGGWQAAQAQQRSNIVQLVGDALLNGRRLVPQQTIQTGDQIDTGPSSNLIFVIGNSSFQVRQNSRLVVERGNSLSIVSVLRLITGGVASAWGKGTNRKIITPTMTAGIRGTGVYTEIFANQNNRSYFCNCYGTVDVEVANQKLVSRASYHQAFWGEVQPVAGRMINPASSINHSDEELEFLARLINERTEWQITGKKSVKDGMGGYMEGNPITKHPADK